MNIDYTDIQPGDDAPGSDGPGAARLAAEPARAHAAPTGATGTQAAPAHPDARPSANVVVLSADPALINLLRDSLAGAHRVWRADDAAHAADLILASGNAVLLVDASLADHNTKDLVTRLHVQFPDLAIIVTGRRDDEQELAHLVSEGAIFRFLHKPASAERIRTFVDATQRRPQGTDHTATMPPRHRNALFGGTAEVPALSPPFNLKFDDGFLRRWSRRTLLLIPIALIAWALLAWEPWKRMSAPAKPVPVAAKATSDGEQAHVQRMLDAAGLALSQGALVEPPGQNALEIYRAVIARDPGNSLARRGIDSVADELIVQAERALMEQDVTRLANTVDAVRSARPEHPRLPFFVGQLEQERTLAAKSGQPVHAVDATGRPLEQPAPAPENPSVRVQAFVQLANDRMKTGQLVGKDGALGYVQSARGIDAADAGVVTAATALAGLFNANAQEAIRAGRLDEADQWLQYEIQLDADRAQIANLRADIDAARIGNQRADRARLLALANQRIAQGRLLEPKGDSARHYLDLLAAADPSFEGLADTQALFDLRTMAEVKAVPSAPPAPQEPVVLPEGKLKRTSFVVPTYPIGAREKRIEGWVDIEFTVTKDGTTRDAIVRAAEPSDTFDRAAIDAVRKWRYEPRVVSGEIVDQRVETRLRFVLSQE